MTGDYLWDGTGWPDPEVRRLERLLGRLKYQPTAPPWPEARSRSWTSAVALLAAAAMIVVLVGLTWWINPASRASLEARRLDGTPTIGTRPLTTTRLRSRGTFETAVRRLLERECPPFLRDLALTFLEDVAAAEPELRAVAEFEARMIRAN